jgi:photosystem II stability/assembly factor-like uncharacterized protein
MFRTRLCRLVLATATLSSGCTFYTQCPAGNSNGGTGNTGGNGGTGGTAGNAGQPAALMGEWVDVTGTLTDLASECGNLSHLSIKADEDRLIAGVAKNGLWESVDAGANWSAIGQAKGSDAIVNRPAWIEYDPEDPQVFWVAGSYGGPGIFRTDDDGAAFTALGISHVDYVTIDFTDPARQTLLTAIHEKSRQLFRSPDGGINWELIGDKMPADVEQCSFPVILDASTYLLGCGTYGGGAPGIFRSTTAGASWTRVSTGGGASAPLFASDGSIYWASEQTGGMVKSTDAGKTWSAPLGAGMLTFVHPIELPDGRIVSASTETLLVSRDWKTNIKAASPKLPFQPMGLVYSKESKAFFIWYSDCENKVHDGAIRRFDFDYETQ